MDLGLGGNTYESDHFIAAIGEGDGILAAAAAQHVLEAVGGRVGVEVADVGSLASTTACNRRNVQEAVSGRLAGVEGVAVVEQVEAVTICGEWWLYFS